MPRPQQMPRRGAFEAGVRAPGGGASRGFRSVPEPGGPLLALSLLAAVLAAPPALAVSEQVPIGARAIAMGGAYSSLSEDATALFWNPAGLARVGHQEIAGSHANLFGSGVVDNLASFVLPFSPDAALGGDWYHSGFDDGTLGFSENRATLGWAQRLRSGVWAGVGAKLVSRGFSLDGFNLRSERGFGLDAGLLVSPVDRLRFALVGQDLSGTRLRSPDGVTTLAYPRNIRLGASYAWRRWGTAAFDVDDRWHTGLEATPLPALALRAGFEADRGGREPGTWTYGLGLTQGIARIDWAHVEPPNLDPSDHFSFALSFNFNPAQVRVEKVLAREVYTSLYKSYAHEPFGTVQLRNLQDRPLETRLSVFIPELMSAPSEQKVILRPKASQEFPLTAVIDQRALAQRGDQPVQVQVGASYASRRLERHEKGSARTVAYAPGAIDWSLGMAQAAAFVSPRDPEVDAIAREAGRAVANHDPAAFGSRNVGFVAAVTEAVAELGLTYVPDPTNPFTSVSETPHAVDTISYPYETLERLSGDCDDSTVLMASLLGNLGVPVKFVDVPGHIFLIYDTGLHERSRVALGVDSSLTVVVDEEVWAPLETTAISKGFVEAWRMGADEIASWSGRGHLGYVDVAESQSRYEPVEPPGERSPRHLDSDSLLARLAAARTALQGMRDTWFVAHFGGAARDMEASAEALLEIARIEFDGGDLQGARSQITEALRKAPQSVAAHNDLGVVLAGLDSLNEAGEHWRTALALGARDPGISLNLGLSRCALGDSLGGFELLGRAIEDAGGIERACGLLGVPASDSLDRAQPSGAASDARRWLRSRLWQATARAGAVPSRRGQMIRTSSASAISPQPLGEQMRHYLYWIE